jgi:hypothetical protein
LFATLQLLVTRPTTAKQKIGLVANLINNCAKQINYLLLNKSNLFNFISRSPMRSIFYEREALSAFARLKQRIVGSGKMSLP